jgi:hypothetical protein
MHPPRIELGLRPHKSHVLPLNYRCPNQAIGAPKTHLWIDLGYTCSCTRSYVKTTRCLTPFRPRAITYFHGRIIGAWFGEPSTNLISPAMNRTRDFAIRTRHDTTLLRVILANASITQTGYVFSTKNT